MRLLFVSDYLNGGGAEIVMHQLKAGLEKSLPGCEIHIFYGSETNVRKSGNPLSYIYSQKWKRLLNRKLNDFRPDVIHFLNYYHILSPSVLDAAKKYTKTNPDCRVVYTAHDFHLVSPSSGLTTFVKGKGDEWGIYREPAVRLVGGLGRFLKKRWDHRGVLFSSLKVLQWVNAYRWGRKDNILDYIIAPGAFMANTIEKLYGNEMVFLIRNPYPDFPEDARVYPSLGYDEKVKLVFGGRLGPEKGLADFINAVDTDLWSEIEMDIYGSGPEEENLSRIIQDKGLAAHC
ncbi:MAG: glycosyltransferase family 4 protein, partial [Okeania sp. SIO3B3]|nr:glycosyltransferase family 4 protein [Okeania sp. SIO3B3]